MNWEPRPLPTVDPETAPFWSATEDGRLLLCECQNCGLQFYYPRSLCPDCASDDVEGVAASGTGTVYSHTVTEHVSNWPDVLLPAVVAYVELDEGPRVLTNVVGCDPADVEIGTRVEVRFVETDRDLAIPVFEPLE
jgi:uncharacterized OB-fold protein